MCFYVLQDANGSIGLTREGKMHTSPIQMDLDETVVKIVSGNDHLCCLTDQGEIYTVGNAEQGQLGRVAECFSCRGGRKGVSKCLVKMCMLGYCIIYCVHNKCCLRFRLPSLK